ncbi:hypothetical protein THAOC_02507 [Thalassiosira oceanica]|uniref:Uncharacterized protein n=1 Tax=Thalassiosira oceanica TaxID=159749 RepID=K0TFF1_THAOC|nr:hypothetical protein THAOC_02507 [Thalassiosira oceanica]|eukprot:EJK75759.1 hypothetical protein THAOC_02507 [Thalassiosira oceanica]
MMGSTKRIVAAAAMAVGSSRAICVHCLALAGNQSFARTRTRYRRSAKSALTMYLDLDGAVDVIVSSSSENLFQSTSGVFQTSSVIASDTRLEAEILNDASYLAFDFSSILFSNTTWLRLCNVLGRIFILTSTYLQSGANVSLDTALLQISMLLVSTHLFLQSVGPQITALINSPSLSVRDRRVYTNLFDPTGVSALQYKTLLASRAIEWVDCHNSSAYLDLNGEFMYFRYTGVVAEETRESTGRGQHRFFGELQFARSLEERSKKRSFSKSKKTPPASNSTLHAERGSSLLRLSSSKILQLMENDDELSTAVPKLILMSLQEKLIAPLEELYDGSV